jgi:heterodisulfide reductase subunit C
MKQLKRLKKMLYREENAEEPEKTEEQSESENKIKSKEIETPKSELKNSEVNPKESEPASSKLTEDKPKEAEEKVSEDPKKVEEKPKTTRSDSMTLLEGREAETLTRDSIDENFKQEVMDAGAETLALCFQCGTCTGACPSGRRTPYRIRQVVRKSVMGFKEDVISDDTLWMCTPAMNARKDAPEVLKLWTS